MKSLKVVGFTRDLGKPLDWDDSKVSCGSLPITDGTVGGYPAMTSVWKPSEEERDLLAAGFQIHLTIIGQVHPPVMVQVLLSEEVVESDMSAELDLSNAVRGPALTREEPVSNNQSPNEFLLGIKHGRKQAYANVIDCIKLFASDANEADFIADSTDWQNSK